MAAYRNPVPTVDLIISMETGANAEGVVLISRKNPPYGWALPGGFVDYGETLEAAAVREAREETTLHVTLERQFHTYSDPSRDPRQHTITTVYIARAEGIFGFADSTTELVGDGGELTIEGFGLGALRLGSLKLEGLLGDLYRAAGTCGE